MEPAELNKAVSDLAWWYGWPPEVMYRMTLTEFNGWLEQATRQIKAGYVKS
ncbi:TPA: GpE family phage tail protein [Neisseria weaveri]